MFFKYPSNLYPLIKNRWNEERWEKEVIPPLPSEAVVKTLLEVVYHASFLTEESRKLWFRVIYVKPGELEKTAKMRGVNTIIFDQPRDFNVGEVVKLAPAANPTQVLIRVYKKKVRSNEIIIWGLVESGDSYWNFLRHESSYGSPPPNGFTLSTKEPGQVNISRQGEVLLNLKQGKIYRTSEIVFYQGPIAQFFENSQNSLYNEVCKSLKTKKWNEYDVDDDYPNRFYIFFLQRVLNRIREKFHGGTLIIIPDHFDVTDTRITDRITIKFPCEYEKSWEFLVRGLVRHKKYYDLHFRLYEQKSITQKEYWEVSHLEHDEDKYNDNISNAVGFLSSLTGVDGAVLITDKFRLLGFGCEIIALSPSLNTVKMITDYQKNTSEERNIDQFGTRHRSALRFCSSFEDCVVFIISQDGDVRAAKRVGPDLLLWSDFNIGTIGF